MPLINPPSAAIRATLANELAVGESTVPRMTTNNSSSTATGFVRLDYFTAQKTETIGQIRTITSTAAAAATPTLIRMGIYSVAADYSLTLIASTPNDTTLFTAVQTAYTKSFSAPFLKTAGQRYAVARLIVTSVAVPNFVGMLFAQDVIPGGRSEFNMDMPIARNFGTTQTDLPATLTGASGSYNTTGGIGYYALLP